ncbi:low affinity immunoglobulin gamma Fc region receptor III-B-like isoform X2 [Alosa pseudoharengus]|uniref:low affinity immunoglobulin gamma Fc region receptor III-B-like isoform X2 n=1 Tax=Alosa pseudoharengus TaxID=34774 RepID=UPI003F8ADDE9
MELTPIWLLFVLSSVPVSISVTVPTLTVHPSPVFSGESVTLTCGIQPSTGWTYQWDIPGSSRDFETNTSFYTISEATVSDQGEYKCYGVRERSRKTSYSNTVQLTVEDGNVILESPAYPVTEGDPLTLRCRYRYQPSNISAVFYKDGTLLQTSTTGEMTIPAVSKSHEGLYKCSNPARGESPESRVTVSGAKNAGSSKLVVVAVCVVGLLFAFALVIVIVLLYRRCKGSGTLRRHPDRQHQSTNQSSDPDQRTNQSSDPDQRTNQSSERNQSQSALREGAQSEYMPLQKSTTDVYETMKPSKDSQKEIQSLTQAVFLKSIL